MPHIVTSHIGPPGPRAAVLDPLTQPIPPVPAPPAASVGVCPAPVGVDPTGAATAREGAIPPTALHHADQIPDRVLLHELSLLEDALRTHPLEGFMRSYLDARVSHVRSALAANRFAHRQRPSATGRW